MDRLSAVALRSGESPSRDGVTERVRVPWTGETETKTKTEPPLGSISDTPWGSATVTDLAVPLSSLLTSIGWVLRKVKGSRTSRGPATVTTGGATRRPLIQ